tara:strand:- start:91 stop:522 length:432 start_codon:yes stop_codon:yes gene_type:complete
VIDSTHRQGDGSLDDWHRMNTARNVALDSPLPLLDQMRDAIADDLDVIVCTSRVMNGRDFRWLDDHGIRGIDVLCRAPSDNRTCGFFKLQLLHNYARSIGYTWARFAQTSLMFDDDKGVQDTLRSVGLRVIDPVNYNFNIRTA